MPILLQHPAQHRLPVFRPAEDFRRWYGDTLKPHESDIINALESVRKCARAPRLSPLSTLQASRHTAPRVLVIDPPGKSSVKLLTSYLAYLDAINPDQDHRTLITDSGRASLKEVASHGYPHARLVTARQGERFRGHSFRRLLMLNIDRYRTYSPFLKHPIHWMQLYRALTAPISLERDSIIILHMSLHKTPAVSRRRLQLLSQTLPSVFNIQTDILERTRTFVRRILEHNCRLNSPVAIPLDWPTPEDDTGRPPSPPPGDSLMQDELRMKNCHTAVVSSARHKPTETLSSAP